VGDEFDEIEQEMAKELAELEIEYNKVCGEWEDLDKARDIVWLNNEKINEEYHAANGAALRKKKEKSALNDKLRILRNEIKITQARNM